MATVKKPSMKSEWRGIKGNKFRVYIVHNHNGIRFLFNDKERAIGVFTASKRVYKKIKERG